MSWVEFHRGYILGHLLFLAALSLSGCVHHAGDVCLGSDAHCEDSKTALSCKDGKLAAFHCGGPKGCVESEKRAVTCDQSSHSVAGAPCLPEYEGGLQCAKDTSSYLRCTNGSWVQLPCRAGKTCDAEGPVLTCK